MIERSAATHLEGSDADRWSWEKVTDLDNTGIDSQYRALRDETRLIPQDADAQPERAPRDATYFALTHKASSFGFISFSKEDDGRLFAQNLWIAPEVRGNPTIWKQLLNCCITYAHEHEVETLYARTSFSNKQAQSIYEKLASKRTVDMRLGHIQYTIPVDNIKRYV
jgi:ribosomal protein S18 acetylase RimI-like enzyme